MRYFYWALIACLLGAMIGQRVIFNRELRLVETEIRKCRLVAIAQDEVLKQSKNLLVRLFDGKTRGDMREMSR